MEVRSENPADHVFVDVDAEGQGDLLSNSPAACRWRIPEITRRWVFDKVRDSVAATDMNQILMA